MNLQILELFPAILIYFIAIQKANNHDFSLLLHSFYTFFYNSIVFFFLFLLKIKKTEIVMFTNGFIRITTTTIRED